jgi:hypothetical protein
LPSQPEKRKMTSILMENQILEEQPFMEAMYKYDAPRIQSFDK